MRIKIRNQNNGDFTREEKIALAKYDVIFYESDVVEEVNKWSVNRYTKYYAFIVVDEVEEMFWLCSDIGCDLIIAEGVYEIVVPDRYLL